MSVGTLQGRARVAEPRAGRWRAPAWADPASGAVAGLMVVAAAVRFWGIGRQGFWFDEGNSVLLAHLSLGKMLGLLPRSESTPPLYYCVAWVWTRAFGYSEAAVRSLSALTGVLVVPVVFATARKLFSDRVGLIAAALTACNPLLIWYSQEARSYELLVLGAAASLLALVLVREQPTPRRVAAWAVVCALALATHYYAVLIVVPEAVWLLAWEPRRRPVQVAVAGVAVWALALLPLAIHQEHTGLGSWIAAAPLGLRLRQVIPQFVVGFQLPAQSVIEPLAVALAAAGAVLVVWQGAGPARRRAGWLAALAIGGLVLNLVLIAGGLDDLLTRNLLALWPAAALVVAAGLGARRAGGLGLAVAVALCAFGLVTVAGVAGNQAYQRPDWRGVARLLGPVGAARGNGTAGAAGTGVATAPAGPALRAILIQHYRDLLPLSLYESGLKHMNPGGATVRELDVVSFTAPVTAGFCWWGSACNLWPSRMQAAYHVPGFRPVSRRRYHQFTVLRMVASAPTQVTPAEVGRAVHSTRWHTDELLVQR